MPHVVKNICFESNLARKLELDSTWQSEKFKKIFLVIPYTRLYFPLEGEGFATFYGKTYHIRPGYMYLIPPFAHVELSCPERLVKYWTHFNGWMQGSALDIFALYPVDYEIPVKDHGFCVDLFQRLVDLDQNSACSRMPELKQLEEQSILSLLLLPFLETIKMNPKSSSSLSTGRIPEILMYIEKKLDHSLTTSVLADEFNLNATYLSNFFSKEMGITLTKYINRRRICSAVTLFWTTDLLVAEVAHRVGIHDMPNFSKLFKKQTGLAPSQFKKLVVQSKTEG